MQKIKLSTPFIAFIQASGLIVYIALVSLFMNLITPMFARANNQLFGMVIILLMLTTSATISASMVLGRSGMLFWEKRYREAFTLLGYTVGWCLFYLFIFVGILAVTQVI